MIINKKEYEDIIRTNLEIEILFKKLIKPNCISDKYSSEAIENGIPLSSSINTIYAIIEDGLSKKEREKELIKKIIEFNNKNSTNGYIKYNNIMYKIMHISDMLYIFFFDEAECLLFVFPVEVEFLDIITNRNELDYWIDSKINNIEQKLIK